MNCAKLKKEMGIFAEGLKIGVQEEILSEDYSEKEAERLNKTFAVELREKLLEMFNHNNKLVNSFNLSQKRFFYSIYEFYDEAKGAELQELFYKLHLDWFKVQEEILHLDCGGYELDYTMASELEKFFSESPERREERLEGPLQDRLKEIDNQIEELNDEKRENTFYQVHFDKEVFGKFISKLEKLTYEK